MVNPFEETIIAGDISLTSHDRVQQERDLRIGETANMYMNTGATNPTQEATRYVDWKYPTVFEDLTPGKSGHPYEGGWGPEHKWARPTDLGYNPLKHILDYSINTVKPAIRDVRGFPQPSWVDEYINRDVPGQEDISMWGGVKKGIHDTGKMFYDKGTDIDKWIFDMFGWSPNEDYYGQPRLNELDDLDEISQSQWKRPENIEKQIDVLEIKPEFEGWSRDEIKAYIFRSTQHTNQQQVNRGGIIGLAGGGNPHAWNPDQEPKVPLSNDLKDQMYDWILQQMMREREKEMWEQWERDRNPMLYPPDQIGGMEV